jgi:cytochrome c5
MTNDADPNVVIQAMMTLNLHRVPDARTIMRRDGRVPHGAWGEGAWRADAAAGVGHPRASGARTTAARRAELSRPRSAPRCWRGEAIYREVCFACHGCRRQRCPDDGRRRGPEARATARRVARVTGHRDYVIKVLLHGFTGPIEDQEYDRAA